MPVHYLYQCSSKDCGKSVIRKKKIISKDGESIKCVYCHDGCLKFVANFKR